MSDYKCDGEIIVQTPTGPAVAAIVVRKAIKIYGAKNSGNIILDELNMTVIKGTIYGLLGASGCGKTTLLSCVVGRKRLNSGEIWVLGGKPGTKESGVPGKRVGYMPQEIALYEEFTIGETMRYFGQIYGMPMKDIEARLKYLIEFLDLPTRDRMIKDLSSGQKRRVSFATALLHNPELLILDEPTVGVDPILRFRIWEYIITLTKTVQTTVIVTTHYMEEAKMANQIGLMRSGILLAEDTPAALMKANNTNNLEDVFVMLSMKQGPTSSDQYLGGQGEPATIEQMCKETDKNILSLPGEKATGSISAPMIQKIYAVVLKNLIRMIRNVGLLFLIVSIPVVKIVLFCLAIGKRPHDIYIGVVNFDVKEKDCPVYEGCTIENLSCRYLTHIDHTVVQQYHEDMDSAIDGIQNGNLYGVMMFNENFTAAIFDRFNATNVTDKTLDQSEIVVRLDMSSQTVARMLLHEFNEAFNTFMWDFMTDCNENPQKTSIALQIKDPIYGSKTMSHTAFIAPGFLITGMFFLSMTLTSMALITERRIGMFDRALIAGVTTGQIIFSQLLTHFMLTVIQTSIELTVVMVIFGITSKGPVPTVVFLTLSSGFSGLCLGFVISAVCNTERNALQATLGIFYPLIFMSGTIWPIHGMPIGLRYFAEILPLTKATQALRSIMNRGWNIDSPDVYIGAISLYVWTTIFLLLTYTLLKLKQYGILS